MDAYKLLITGGTPLMGETFVSGGKNTSVAVIAATLLSDEDHKVIEMYDVWKEKKMAGRTYMGIVRSTYLIDEDGVIVKTYGKVKPGEHGDEVLGDLG